MLSWKMRREINRMVEQAQALVSFPFEPLFQLGYDCLFYRLIKISHGAQPSSPKIAVFLVYQPEGIVSSVFDTLSHLSANGYSTLIVSNARLAVDDLNALIHHCWLIVERPNYGYDFGGYRDGVRIIRELGISPESLIILNDSIWWPILDDDSIVQRVEQSPSDITGTIIHYPVARPFSPQSRPSFLESYFYHFNEKALASSSFTRFWKTYRLSSIKYNAVHRGERRLSQVLARGGLSFEGLFSRESFLNAIQELDPISLLNVLNYGAYIDAAFLEERESLSSSFSFAPAWRDQALSFLEKTTIRRGFHVSFPLASIGILGATFIKKSPAQANGGIQHLMRDKVLTAVKNNVISPLRPAVFEEIQSRQLKGASAVGR